MIKETNQILTSPNEKPIVYDFFYVPSEEKLPLVIFCHGYKGFKDWGAWDLVAEAFANNGYAFLKFNFSHNGGTPQNPIDFPDLEAFATNTYSKELEDLKRVHTYIKQQPFKQQINLDELSLIGHSRGSGIVLIYASENTSIKNVITWAGVCDYKVRFQEETEAFQEWKEKGIFYIENTRTHQMLPHYFSFYTDFIENQDRLTISKAVQSLSSNLLILHGDKDTTVTIKEAQALHAWKKESTLTILPNADHVFGASHPWTKKTLPNDLEKVVDLSLNYLK